MPPISLMALFLLGLADPPTPLDVATALETATIQAIERARPSVVAITRVRNEDPNKTTAIRGQNAEAPTLKQHMGMADGRQTPGEWFFPGEFSAGVVIGTEGEILTTYHSLMGARQIYVRTADRQQFEAEILAADPRSDLAVIVPREGTGASVAKLKPIPLGPGESLRPGSFLFALGNSFNAARDGRASAGFGILANTARRVHATNDKGGVVARGQYFRYQPTLLQLDTKLNLGMSGGAVINLKGELVGITTAAASAMDYDALAGYAIPMDALGRRIAETLKQGREVEYGFLGIGLNEAVANAIHTVGSGTPADQADLKVDDVIVAVGSHALSGDDALTMALSNVPVGQTIKLKVLRDGETLEKSIFVSKYPVEGQVIAANRPKAWRGVRVDFASVLIRAPFAQNLTEAMARGGVAASEIEPGSSAEVAGLRMGLLITHVNDKPVRSPADFAREVAKAGDQDVTLTTQGGQRQNVVVKK